MNSELQRLTQRLEKLALQRSQVTTKLASVDLEIATTINARNQKQRELSVKKNTTTEKSIVTDSKGDRITIGDHVETVTRGKYYERRGEVIGIKAKNNTITIRYLSSKKETWRKSQNVRKIAKGSKGNSASKEE